jgi:hypothetical protein
MHTLARGASKAPFGSDLRHRGSDRIALENDGLIEANSGPSQAMDGETFKIQLRQELLIQAQARLPMTYASLAERLVVAAPDAMGAIRTALEQLMDDDADEGRPFLAAVVVRAAETGLPAPWFFRKAASLGLFAGDPTNVEAYAFHATEFHSAIRFYASPPHEARGAGEVLPSPVA